MPRRTATPRARERRMPISNPSTGTRPKRVQAVSCAGSALLRAMRPGPWTCSPAAGGCAPPWPGPSPRHRTFSSSTSRRTSRPGCDRLARELAAALSRNAPAHLPRSGVSRSDRRSRRSDPGPPHRRLHRQLLRIRAASGRRDRAIAPDRRTPATRAGTHAGVHRPLPLQGEQGAAGAESAQGPGADAGGRTRRRAEAICVRLLRAGTHPAAGRDHRGGLVRISRARGALRSHP